MSIGGLRGSDAVNYDDPLPPEEPAEEPAAAAATPPAAGTIPPAASGHPILLAGASGRAVYALQELVNIYARSGRIVGMPPVPVNGEFDNELRSAIRRIQSKEQLPTTSMADPMTWATLEFAKTVHEIKNPPAPVPAEEPSAATATPPAAPPRGHPILSRGDSGPEVYALQKLVNSHRRGHPRPLVPLNGEFDNTLSVAIRSIQNRERLPLTGIADPMTWATLEFKKTVDDIKYGPEPEPVPEPKYPRATSFSDEIDGRPGRP